MKQEHTLAEFIAEQELSMTAQAIPARTDGLMDTSTYHWLCVLKAKDRTMTLQFSCGAARVKAPELAEVLDCIASDCGGFENARSFEDWAREWGFDEDSRKAERVYHAVRDQYRDAERLLGRQALQVLMFETVRL